MLQSCYRGAGDIEMASRVQTQPKSEASARTCYPHATEKERPGPGGAIYTYEQVSNVCLSSS